MIYLVAVAGWLLAILFILGWYEAVWMWDKADNELNYLRWRCRMRDEREGTNWLNEKRI